MPRNLQTDVWYFSKFLKLHKARIIKQCARTGWVSTIISYAFAKHKASHYHFVQGEAKKSHSTFRPFSLYLYRLTSISLIKSQQTLYKFFLSSKVLSKYRICFIDHISDKNILHIQIKNLVDCNISQSSHVIIILYIFWAHFYQINCLDLIYKILFLKIY